MNNFTSMPSEIGLLKNLQELFLSHNNLTSIPPEIGLLTQLQELDLRINDLRTLPIEMGLLANLRDLYINRDLHHLVPKKLLPITVTYI